MEPWRDTSWKMKSSSFIRAKKVWFVVVRTRLDKTGHGLDASGCHTCHDRGLENLDRFRKWCQKRSQKEQKHQNSNIRMLRNTPSARLELATFRLKV